MRKILLSILIIFTSCNSIEKEKKQTKLKTDFIEEKRNAEFDLLEINEEFTLIINEYYKNRQAVGPAVGYDLFIGKTIDSLLPNYLTVLSFLEIDKKIEIGDSIRFLPNEKQYDEIEGYGIYYYAKDSLIDGKMETHVLGSDHKAIWADLKLSSQ